MKKKDWEIIRRNYPLGKILKGKVISHFPFGIFIDIGDEDVIGIVPVVDFAEKNPSKREYPPIGEEVNCIIFGYTNDDRNQIWVSINPKVFCIPTISIGISWDDYSNALKS
jgi:ribosomal protein S1